jgi:hypothetical protein
MDQGESAWATVNMVAPVTAVCIHTDADGRSRLTDLSPPMLAEMIGGAATTRMGVVTGGGPSFRDWHVAGMAGLSIVLSGEWEIEAGSGARRMLGPGSVLVMLDTQGQGHRSRSAADVTVLGIGIDEAARAAVSALVAQAKADA